MRTFTPYMDLCSGKCVTAFKNKKFYSKDDADKEIYDYLAGLEKWLDDKCSALGAVDGYDYNSGTEYGLRIAALEVQKRKKAVENQSSMGVE